MSIIVELAEYLRSQYKGVIEKELKGGTSRELITRGIGTILADSYLQLDPESVGGITSIEDDIFVGPAWEHILKGERKQYGDVFISKMNLLEISKKIVAEIVRETHVRITNDEKHEQLMLLI